MVCDGELRVCDGTRKRKGRGREVSKVRTLKKRLIAKGKKVKSDRDIKKRGMLSII